jgi:hypothetical protein
MDMKKEMIPLIGMILALVLIIVALVGPWYSMSFMGMGGNFYLTKAEMAGTTVPYDDTMGDAKASFDNTMYITMVALIFAIIAIIGILGAQFNLGKPDKMRMLAAIFGILTFILAIIAPIYFMTSGFGEVLNINDFWNELAGPGYAWYLMIVAAIIALIASIPLLKKQATTM